MNFNDSDLVAKYGTWMKVQVAFYDHVFQTASDLCAAHWNEELGMKNFQDGRAFYDETVKTIAEIFPTPEDAWKSFLK